MSDYDYAEGSDPDPGHDPATSLADAMQRHLNLRYFDLGRQSVMDGYCWFMDLPSLELLRGHMGLDERPTRCAGLPIFECAAGWSLGRLPMPWIVQIGSVAHRS